MFMYQAPHVLTLIMLVSAFIHLLRSAVLANICSQEYFQYVKMWQTFRQPGMYVNI